MTDQRRPRPFNERFVIEVGVEDAQRRFMNRVGSFIFKDIQDLKGDLTKDELTDWEKNQAISRLWKRRMNSVKPSPVSTTEPIGESPAGDDKEFSNHG